MATTRSTGTRTKQSTNGHAGPARQEKLAQFREELANNLAREISPRRKTTKATDVEGLVSEQLAHFGIDILRRFQNAIIPVELFAQRFIGRWYLRRVGLLR